MLIKSSSYLFLFWFLSIEALMIAQEKDFLKGIINDQIKLELSPQEMDMPYLQGHKDSNRVIELNVNKSPIIFPTYNYGLNALNLKEIEDKFPEQDSLVISPKLFVPFTNLKKGTQWDGQQQLEYLHGSLYMVPRPDYSRSGIRPNRKSYKESKKLEKLRYIIEEVYQLGDSIWKPSK